MYPFLITLSFYLFTMDYYLLGVIYSMPLTVPLENVLSDWLIDSGGTLISPRIGSCYNYLQFLY